jgi:hypothetical protein
VTRRDTGSSESASPKTHGEPTKDAEWIRVLPGDAVESHPVVRDLRRRLEAREADLAAKEREIARLQVAVAFGLREVPGDRGRVAGAPVP